LQGGDAVSVAGWQGGSSCRAHTVKELLLCCRPFCTLRCALLIAGPASALFVRRRERGIGRFLAASVRLCILPRVRVATSEQKTTGMGTEKERERYVYLAKLSEQAERYDGTFPWPRVCLGCVCDNRRFCV